MHFATKSSSGFYIFDDISKNADINKKKNDVF